MHATREKSLNFALFGLLPGISRIKTAPDAA
jgi:hypothetical protein